MNQKTKTQIVDEFLNLEYGLSYKDLIELDKLCQKKKLNWYQLFYVSQEEEKKILKSILKKYKKYGITQLDLNYLALDIGASCEKNHVKEAYKKIAGTKKVEEILGRSERFKNLNFKSTEKKTKKEVLT